MNDAKMAADRADYIAGLASQNVALLQEYQAACRAYAMLEYDSARPPIDVVHVTVWPKGKTRRDSSAMSVINQVVNGTAGADLALPADVWLEVLRAHVLRLHTRIMVDCGRDLPLPLGVHR